MESSSQIQTSLPGVQAPLLLDLPGLPRVEPAKPLTVEPNRTVWPRRALEANHWRFLLSWGTSAAVHLAAFWAIASQTSSQLPRIHISEVGPNSAPLIASMSNAVPPSDVDILLPKVTTQQTAADPRKTTLPPKVDATESPTRHDVEPPLDRPVLAALVETPRALSSDVAPRASREIQEHPPSPTPNIPPPPRTVQSHEVRRQRVEVSAASLASAGAEPSRGADVVRPPRPVVNPAPAYPPEALSARQTGRVVLRVRVGIDGSVLEASLHESSGNLLLDNAALSAVRNWRFEAAQRAGRPIEHEIAVPIRFVIPAVR